MEQIIPWGELTPRCKIYVDREKDTLWVCI
jgi:hypothetical protein